MSEKKKIKSYYNEFSNIYDLLSPKIYYHNAREFAVSSLNLREGQVVLNVPVGTGQNFQYLQHYLNGTGQIIGIDLSDGMLSKASKRINKNQYTNIILQNMDVENLNMEWLRQYLYDNPDKVIDSILCDLGLSGFSGWEQIIDNFLAVLKPGGKLVVMDWELQEPSFRGELIKWIGGGDVDRPIPAYLSSRLKSYQIDHSFNRGGVFVASGYSKKIK